MRELIFRAWVGGRFEYNVMVGKFGNFYVNPELKNDGLDPSDLVCISPYNTKYSENVPIEQFTGLLDINGNKIFEGDIIRNVADIEIWQRIGNVFYHDIWAIGWSMRAYNSQYQLNSNDTYEIIGNIHQSPELLEPK